MEHPLITELKETIMAEVLGASEEETLDIAYLIHIITLERMKEIKEEISK